MKKLILALMVMMLLAACAPAAEQAPASGLTVTVGENQNVLSAKDLGALTATESSFKGVAYKGVTAAALLDSLSIDPASVKAIKAVAADGFSVNYDPAVVLKDNVIVAYALADGSAMSSDDGSFRMVLPDEEGKLNIRMLAELQIIQ